MLEQTQNKQIEDVEACIHSFGSLAAAITEGHPGKVIMMAAFMSNLLQALVRWEVVTEQQLNEVLERLDLWTPTEDDRQDGLTIRAIVI